MSNDKHPLSWFIERIGKTVVCTAPWHEPNMDPESELFTIKSKEHAIMLLEETQELGFTFRDPHPLTSSILTCSVISCDTCGKIGTTEDLDKEVAAKGFEGEGWKRLSNGTINCGCK